MALALVTASAAGAYEGEVAATITGTGPGGTQACDTAIAMSATVQDVTGKLIDAQPVAWAFVSGNIAGDAIAEDSTMTNASGVATTTLHLSCTARSVTMSVTADEANGSFVIVQAGAVVAPVVNPAPTAEPLASTPAPAESVPVALIVALVALVGAAGLLFMLARSRRPAQK